MRWWQNRHVVQRGGEGRWVGDVWALLWKRGWKTTTKLGVKPLLSNHLEKQVPRFHNEWIIVVSKYSQLVRTQESFGLLEAIEATSDRCKWTFVKVVNNEINHLSACRICFSITNQLNSIMFTVYYYCIGSMQVFLAPWKGCCGISCKWN